MVQFPSALLVQFLSALDRNAAGNVGHRHFRPFPLLLGATHSRCSGSSRLGGGIRARNAPLRRSGFHPDPVQVAGEQVFPAQVTFAEEHQSSVLGMVTLETALLAVDPVGQRLAPVEAERL